MEIPRQSITIWAVLVVVWNPIARATDPPQPTPTPRPGTLAALAQSTSLMRQGSTPIVITDDNLEELSGGAVVTVMTTTAAEFAEIDTQNPSDSKTREMWRKKVLSAKKHIAVLEAKRAAVETEINRLERGNLNARTLDRIEQAEDKLRAVDADIASARVQLSRIVHEARKKGAQPGWFR